MSAISLSIITGSVFFRLPVTSEGAFTREGVLFVAMLFNVFIGESTRDVAQDHF